MAETTTHTEEKFPSQHRSIDDVGATRTLSALLATPALVWRTLLTHTHTAVDVDDVVCAHTRGIRKREKGREDFQNGRQRVARRGKGNIYTQRQ